MAKLHARPSNQYRYEHYDPFCPAWQAGLLACRGPELIRRTATAGMDRVPPTPLRSGVDGTPAETPYTRNGNRSAQFPLRTICGLISTGQHST
jgi:hypothetical protein